MEIPKIFDRVSLFRNRPDKESMIVSPAITVHTLREKGEIKTV